jgi:hypothetical protein
MTRLNNLSCLKGIKTSMEAINADFYSKKNDELLLPPPPS